MRVSKDAEERRNEILDISNRLFNKKGYDNTSVADIISEVGIAKGTLYYYFKSKEDIMNAIIERLSGVLLSNASKVIEDNTLSVEEKLLKCIQSLNIQEDEGKEIIMHIHKPQNALMHQKELDRMISGVTPLVTKIIEEGIDKGIFKCKYPYESVEMAIIYSQIAFDNLHTLSQEEAIKKINAFIYNLEKLFGTEPGGMNYLMKLFM